ncbi:MAG: hypothetical protein CMI03_15020, partial [Oceanospirillaceae bacterium]|nr:hypothetical protein [Oceanospirillaceae bacterium]
LSATGGPSFTGFCEHLIANQIFGERYKGGLRPSWVQQEDGNNNTTTLVRSAHPTIIGVRD